MSDPIRFDDIDAIGALASEEFGDWGEALEVTQEMINQFADLTRDQQWIHVDVERTRRESPFGGPIAHGFLTLSLLPAVSRHVGVALTGQTNVVNYGAESLRFLSPVPAGASIHARGRLVRAEARSGGTLLTTEVEIRVVGAEKPALLYRLQVLYRG